PDAKTASDKLIQIRNLVTLVGSQAGLTIQDESYNGTTIGVIDLSWLAPLLLGTLGAATNPGQTPGASSVLGALGDLKIAFAQKDDLVIAGIGDTFVKAVLDTKPGSSLADHANYRSALDRAGAANGGQLYADIQ